MNPKYSIDKMLERNAQQDCIIPGCNKKRSALTRYCSAHNYRRRQFGSPYGYRVKPNDVRLERIKAEHIVKNNQDHPAIEMGCSYFQNWIEQAQAQAPGICAAKEFRRLGEDGVSGEDLFIEVIAVALFAEANPDTVPQNEGPEPYQIALALAVLCFKKGVKRGAKCIGHIKISSETRREVGKVLWNDLSRVIVQVKSAIQEREKEEEAKLYKQQQRFIF